MVAPKDILFELWLILKKSKSFTIPNLENRLYTKEQ